ncbi:MAG: hypothetical protein AB1696_22505 [Planctomycetota bacterium]
MKQAVVIGAGGVGLGFIAPELHHEYHITYVDVDASAEMIHMIQSGKPFSINIAGPSVQVVAISGAKALNSDIPAERKKAVRTIASADLLFTATGAKFLASIAPLIRNGILEAKKRKRKAPLPICCCENGKEIAATLRRFVFEGLRRRDFPFVRFSDTVIARMCQVEDLEESRRSLRACGHDAVADQLRPLAEGMKRAVVVEPYFGIVIEAQAVRGADIPLDMLRVATAKEFKALDDQKTFVHNGGHGLISYLGHLRGYRQFHEVREDREIYEIARAAMVDEVGAALVAEYAPILTRHVVRNHAHDLLRRMTCPYFNDSIERGVRGSLAKLGPHERFIGGARLCARHGIAPTNLAHGIAAGLAINAADPAVKGKKLDDILRDVCTLDPKKERAICECVRKALEGDAVGARKHGRR